METKASVSSVSSYTLADAVKLEEELKEDKDNIRILLDLTTIYLDINKRIKAVPHIIKAIKSFEKSQISIKQGIAIAELAIKVWKSGNYKAKTDDNIRLDFSSGTNTNTNTTTATNTTTNTNAAATTTTTTTTAAAATNTTATTTTTATNITTTTTTTNAATTAATNTTATTVTAILLLSLLPRLQ